MFAPDGYKILLTGILIFLGILILTFVFPYTVLIIITVLAGLLCLFNFYFLRDPERKITAAESQIVSPADGTVIKIEQRHEPYYFQDTVTCVSIFMSVMNVHVNRIPISGTVDFIKYIKGTFRVAYVDKASEENEQTIVGIRQGSRKVLFKQIAGVIARRIICRLQPGQQVRAGERFGLIRYGSRVDIFFDNTVLVNVKPKQKVYGGISVIGEFKS